MGLGGDARSMGQTPTVTSSPSTSHVSTERWSKRMELINKVEDEVDRQSLKDLLIDDTKGLTVRHLASKEWREPTIISLIPIGHTLCDRQ